MRKNYTILFLFLASVSVTGAQGWTELGTGSNALNANNTIYTICTDTLDNVFAGGNFTNGSNNYIAYFNGSTWTNLWNGVFNGAINSICYSPITGPYAGGQFTDNNGNYYVASEYAIGTLPNLTYEWQDLDSLSANGQIRALCINQLNNLLAAGDFTNTQGLPYVIQGPGNIIDAWIPYGNSYFDSASSIYSICYDAEQNVYASGTFHDNIDVFADSNSISWVRLGLNANRAIYTICSANGNIYAAGNFSDANGHYYVAVYNNNAWSELANITTQDSLKANGAIRTICADNNGNIYAAGDFTNTDGKYYVAVWNGSAWSELGAGSNALSANGAIYALCTDRKDNVYAAGDFTDANSKRYVAKSTGINAGIIPVESPTANFKIYPNPATNALNITCTGQLEGTHYTIFDLLGNTIYTGVLISNYTPIDISSFATGMYLVQIGENQKQAFKVIKGEF